MFIVKLESVKCPMCLKELTYRGGDYFCFSSDEFFMHSKGTNVRFVIEDYAFDYQKVLLVDYAHYKMSGELPQDTAFHLFSVKRIKDQINHVMINEKIEFTQMEELIGYAMDKVKIFKENDVFL